MDQTQNDSFSSLSGGQVSNVGQPRYSSGSVSSINSGSSGQFSDQSGNVNKFVEMPSYSSQQIFSPTSMGDTVFLNNGSRKSKKWVWALVGILVLIGGIAAVVAITTYNNNQRIEKMAVLEEALPAFRESFADLVYYYENGGIGERPYESLLKEDGKSFFQIKDDYLVIIEEQLTETKNAYRDLDVDVLRSILDEENRKLYDETGWRVENTLETMSWNVGVLRKFYDVFAAPTYDLIDGKTMPREECSSLYNEKTFSEDPSLLDAALQYQKAYCYVNTALYQDEDFEISGDPEIEAAKISLARVLKDTDYEDFWDDFAKITIRSKSDE